VFLINCKIKTIYKELNNQILNLGCTILIRIWS